MLSWWRRNGRPRLEEPGAEEITARALKAELDQNRSLFLLDVREPEEFEFCRLPGARLVPLGELQQRVGELDPDQDTVVYCRSGHRSGLAAEWLRAAGFRRVRNLAGGIDAWSAQVDPDIPRY